MVNGRVSGQAAVSGRPVRVAPKPARFLSPIDLEATSSDAGSVESGGSLDELVSACVLGAQPDAHVAIKLKGSAAAGKEQSPTPNWSETHGDGENKAWGVPAEALKWNKMLKLVVGSILAPPPPPPSGPALPQPCPAPALLPSGMSGSGAQSAWS